MTAAERRGRGAPPALLPASGVALHDPGVTRRLAYRRYRLPFRDALRTAHGPWQERKGLLVRVENAAGRPGFGEVAPLPEFGTETLAEAETALAGLGRVVDDATLAKVPERLGGVRFALASALAAETVDPPGAARLAVARLLPAGRSAFAVADRAAAEGFVAFKWKVGVARLEDELAILDDLLARLPGGARLRLDANGAWTSRQAGRWLERCADRPIEFIEQPVAPGNDDTLRGLAADFPTPLALDESVTGLASLRRWLDRGWPGVVVVKPALAGAPADVLVLLEARRADVVFSSAFETAVGRRAALEMALRHRSRQPARALGFGAGPLFGDTRFDGPAVTPFVSGDEIKRIDPEAAWNALT